VSRKVRIIKAWADVGSHDGVFIFESGPIYSMYGPVMHVYASNCVPGLTPIEIHVPRKKWLKLKREQPQPPEHR
jgi:hypothetical protein